MILQNLSTLRSNKGLKKITFKKGGGNLKDKFLKKEEEFRLLVEGVKEYAMYALTPEGRVATWNSGAERIKGYTEEEAVGLNFEVFFTSEDRKKGLPAKLLEEARKAWDWGFQL